MSENRENPKIDFTFRFLTFDLEQISKIPLGFFKVLEQGKKFENKFHQKITSATCIRAQKLTKSGIFHLFFENSDMAHVKIAKK